MTTRGWSLAALIVLLAVIYVRGFTSWFRKPEIHISVTSRPGRPGMAADQAAPIVFGLDGDYSLKSVRVVSLSTTESNSPRLEVWSVEGKGKIPPTRGFPYGDPPEGLNSRQGVSEAQPLIPGMPYRIEVTSGRAHGQQDFTPASAGE
jgi:hypothetical protein